MYATKYDKPEILRYILEFIKEGAGGQELHASRTGHSYWTSAPGGLEACQSDDQRAIVEQFRQQMKPREGRSSARGHQETLVLRSSKS